VLFRKAGNCDSCRACQHDGNLSTSWPSDGAIAVVRLRYNESRSKPR
jgi:hypothetical protein